MGPHNPSGRLGREENFSPDRPACSSVTIVTTPSQVSDYCLTKIKGTESHAVMITSKNRQAKSIKNEAESEKDAE